MPGQLEMWAPLRRPAPTGPVTHLRLTHQSVTACGQKIAKGTGHPFVGVQHAPHHIAGYGLELCSYCAAVTTVAANPAKEI